MSVSVRIPTILRTYTGGESEVSAEGDTLAAVLDDLDASYAGIKGRILDEAGKLPGDARLALLRDLERDVGEQHAIAGLGGNLGYPRAHLPRADHAHDIHADLPVPGWPGSRV